MKCYSIALFRWETISITLDIIGTMALFGPEEERKVRRALVTSHVQMVLTMIPELKIVTPGVNLDQY